MGSVVSHYSCTNQIWKDTDRNVGSVLNEIKFMNECSWPNHKIIYRMALVTHADCDWLILSHLQVKMPNTHWFQWIPGFNLWLFDIYYSLGAIFLILVIFPLCDRKIVLTRLIAESNRTRHMCTLTIRQVGYKPPDEPNLFERETEGELKVWPKLSVLNTLQSFLVQPTAHRP